MGSGDLVLKPSTASLLWPLVACLAFVAMLPLVFVMKGRAAAAAPALAAAD